MEAKCKFHTDYGMLPPTPPYYKCEIMELTIVEGEREIKSFTGTHEEGKSNDDVEWLWIYEKRIKFVPRNLHKSFPNLKCLRIIQCDIEEVSREDLKGLENLEYFDITNGKLTSLPDDLFADMKNLQHICFNCNKIERMSSNLLQPIKSTLNEALFEGNPKFSDWFNAAKYTRNDWGKFIRLIDSKFGAEESESSENEIAEVDNDNEWIDVEEDDSSESEIGDVVSKFSKLQRPTVGFDMFAANAGATNETFNFKIAKPDIPMQCEKESTAPKLNQECRQQ